MVPGMDVGQINSNTWAIGARGDNGRFSNELLVMVDGRTVWEHTDFWRGLLGCLGPAPGGYRAEIEVIRGPGGSIWGDNAVIGVVNIITKTADDTPGGIIVAGGGNLDKGFRTLQYGGKIGRATSYRVYGKVFESRRFAQRGGPKCG